MPAFLSHPPTFRPLHLGVDLTGTGAAPAIVGGPHRRAARAFDAARTADLVAAAERGLLDLVTLDDAFAVRPTGRELRGHLDSAVIASRLARTTSRLGVVASLDPLRVPHDHVVTALSRLARTSESRIGWQVEPPGAVAPERTPGTASVPDAVGAVLDALPAQQAPPVVVRATAPAHLAVAARRADVVRVRAADLQEAAAMRRLVGVLAAEAGRDPGRIRVLAEVRVVLGANEATARMRADLAGVAPGALTHVGTAHGLAALAAEAALDGLVDGFHVLPVVPDTDLTVLVRQVVPMLRRAGLFRTAYPGTTLRDTLGLSRHDPTPSARPPSRARARRAEGSVTRPPLQEPQLEEARP